MPDIGTGVIVDLHLHTATSREPQRYKETTLTQYLLIGGKDVIPVVTFASFSVKTVGRLVRFDADVVQCAILVEDEGNYAYTDFEKM